MLCLAAHDGNEMCRGGRVGFPLCSVTSAPVTILYFALFLVLYIVRFLHWLGLTKIRLSDCKVCDRCCLWSCVLLFVFILFIENLAFAIGRRSLGT